MSQAVYPHVVVRLMAAVYNKAAIVFVGPTEKDGLLRDDRYGGLYFAVCCEKPLDNGRFTQEAKMAAAMLVRRVVLDKKMRMCAVFAENDSIYIELDGTMKASDDPPDGMTSIDVSELQKK